MLNQIENWFENEYNEQNQMKLYKITVNRPLSNKQKKSIYRL